MAPAHLVSVLAVLYVHQPHTRGSVNILEMVTATVEAMSRSHLFWPPVEVDTNRLVLYSSLL